VTLFIVFHGLLLTEFCGFRLLKEDSVKSNAMQVLSKVPLGSFERDAFYPWSNGTNLLFKRGPALIFSYPHSQLANDFKEALTYLEYSPMLINLSDLEATLQNGKLSLRHHVADLNHLNSFSEWADEQRRQSLCGSDCSSQGT
jgi:hypothetical protein